MVIIQVLTNFISLVDKSSIDNISILYKGYMISRFLYKNNKIAHIYNKKEIGNSRKIYKKLIHSTI